MRRATIAIVVALVMAGTACAQERPGLFSKWFGREKPKARPQESSVLARLDVKLAKAKSDRQQLARLGAEPVELRRMDARVDGLERMRELIVTREEMVRSGRPRSEVEAVDEQIFGVRRSLKKLNDQRAAPRVERARTDLWSAPRGSRANQAYEPGTLRRAMGI